MNIRMNIRTMTIIAAASLIAATAISPAQESKPVGLSVRVGIFWPSSNTAKAEGKTWIGFGAEYKLGDLNIVRATVFQSTTSRRATSAMCRFC
jgi:hypothetical protein